MPVALEQFVKQLSDSGIIAPAKLQDFVPPKASPKDAKELVQELVKQKYLTKYQAREVYEGRAKSLILGNYTILDKIGAGGMGQVFKAEHRRMHRTVAIKMLPSSVTKDARAIARFEREVEAAAKLRHPNIVAADDSDEANGIHFLVMEFVEGSDLSALVKKDGPVSIDKAVNYVLQAARGLDFAHGEGVVHRDIKPANLLLDKKGTLKILDMGLARLETHSGDAATQAELTNSGMVMGTVDFMSPEQAFNSKHADARADIYSLGCTLYYLLSGKAAYDGETLMEKLLAHREKPIPSLKDAQPNVPKQVEDVFRRMVAKHPQDRYQTMSEVVADLQDCVPLVSGTPKADSPSSISSLSFLKEAAAQTHKTAKHPKPVKSEAEPPSRWNRKKLALVGSGFLAVVLLAGVIIKLQTKDGMLIVEIDQPDATVEVLNEEGKVEITRPGEQGTITIGVDPGKHRLKVSKGGFDVYGEEFEIEKAGKKSVTAKLIPLKWNTPEFQKWVKEVAGLPAEQQVEAVVKKLIEVNPGCDRGGVGEVKIENGVVTELHFLTDKVTDISPVRALSGLKTLFSTGSRFDMGTLVDLSPLYGSTLTELHCEYNPRLANLSPLQAMHLTHLICFNTRVADLSPVKGMALTHLDCGFTAVADLAPLKGMRLTNVTCWSSNVSDLSPLQGMPLTQLLCSDTHISDLSPLANLPLKELACDFNPKRDAEILRSIKTLETINGKPVKEFWAEADAGAADQTTKPWNTPAFKKWMKEVAALTAEKQVEAVANKLQELNSGFDGKEIHRIENAVVTDLQFATVNVTDISPVRALTGLKRLHCESQTPGTLSDLSPLKGLSLTNLVIHNSQVSDLTPLRGMPLEHFQIPYSPVSDLSPLRGMPLRLLDVNLSSVFDMTPLHGMALENLNIRDTRVSDLSPLAGMPINVLHCENSRVRALSPLKGMPLTVLSLDGTGVSDLTPLSGMRLDDIGIRNTAVFDLSPLRGMPLTKLFCEKTQVKEFSPLKDIPLKELWCDFKPERDTDIFRAIKTLEKINGKPAAEFWKEVEAASNQ